uniref:UEV domain-containing protein n=1 Tax=Oryza barthii TaxID=65489 RepID=A0A0D3FCI7_9ORYZ
MAPPPPSPSPSPASGAQYAHQFLNTALSQRGPSALPYAEDVKWLIRNHLVALADAFPSLHPKAALFTHNDGRAAHLLQADGTIPIHHAGASYNLPAVLWLPEPYPRSPPLVFLSPTRDMLAARPPPTEDPAEVYKRNAIAKLVDMAYADAATLRPVREAEVDTLFAMQATLRSRGEVVSDGVRKMGEEKEALERRLQDVMMATDLMEAWVMENTKGAAGDTEADEAIETADVLSKQMLECTAADLALEDTIYALDKAIQEGSVPFDGYLRSVRALAREQFFQRVLSTKVNKAQQQAQVARMAARAPQYAS